MQSRSSSQISTPVNNRQKVQDKQTNPVVQSLSLSVDEKPLSEVSILTNNRQQFRNQIEPPGVQELKQLEGYQKRDTPNGVYYGQIVNEKKHGFGILVYSDGRMCEGQWQNDRKYGECRETLPSGDFFQGTYVNGKQQGYGIMSKVDGERYEGEWVNGYKQGKGKWWGANGDTYDGDWKFGKIDGMGVYVNTQGDKYTGSFRNNLKHGHGTEHFQNGDVYAGEYVNGKPEGQGFYLWANGNEYRGMFMSGHRHGQGKWVKWVLQDVTQEKQCYSYEGEYENDKKHGEGVFIWPSGNFYKGQFVNDFRHGYGEMHWIDGSHYKGMWEQGKQHGEGELYKRAQGFRRGFFENNVLIQQKRPESGSRQATKIIWQKDDRLNMSCYVLDRSRNSETGQPQNNTFHTAKDAKNNFLPSIATKPAYLMYKEGALFTGRAKNLSETFIEHSFEDDPDFQTRQGPIRLTKARMVNHFYSTKQKEKVDLTFSLKKAFA